MVHKSEETEVLVLNLYLGSQLVPNHSAKIPFDHLILEFWKTDKVLTFAVDYMLAVYAYVYTHIKRQYFEALWKLVPWDYLLILLDFLAFIQIYNT